MTTTEPGPARDVPADAIPIVFPTSSGELLQGYGVTVHHRAYRIGDVATTDGETCLFWGGLTFDDRVEGECVRGDLADVRDDEPVLIPCSAIDWVEVH